MKFDYTFIVFYEPLAIASCDVIVLWIIEIQEIRLDLPCHIVAEKATEIEFLDNAFLNRPFSRENNYIFQRPRFLVVNEISRSPRGANPPANFPVPFRINERARDYKALHIVWKGFGRYRRGPELPNILKPFQFLAITPSYLLIIDGYAEASRLRLTVIKHVKSPSEALAERSRCEPGTLTLQVA